jgi:hypothetical protein
MAVLVFDRTDSNRLRVLADCPDLFPLGPGGSKAPEWSITVVYGRKVVPGIGHTIRHRDLVVERLRPTVLSADEEHRAETGAKKLPDLLAPASPGLIAQMMEEATAMRPGDQTHGSRQWWRARERA